MTDHATTIEALASIEHDQWVAWAKTIMQQEPIGIQRIARWNKYMVPYAELPEDVKEHDRVWARKILAAIEAGEVPGVALKTSDGTTCWKCEGCGRTRTGRGCMTCLEKERDRLMGEA
jgi:hypothetical protein